MTIYVNGSFNTWDEKKQYSISVYGADEEILKVWEKYLKSELDKALKSENYDKVQGIAYDLQCYINSVNSAIEEAKKEEEEFKKQPINEIEV